jgi:drug/metabolite transporter (DMT)-like permease
LDDKGRVRSPYWVYALLLLVMVLWSGNAIVGRAVRGDIPPFSLALGRWAGALSILLPLSWGKLRADWQTVRTSWTRILLLGVLGVASFNAFFYAGLRWTTASNATLLQAGIPMLVLVFNWALFRSRPAAAQVVGVCLAAVGVMTIIFRADWALLLALSFGRGDALVLCAVVAWALYTTLLRLRPPIHPLSFLTLTFAIGVAAMLPLASLEWQTETIRFTPRVAGGLAYVAVLPSIVAYLLFNRAVAEIGAAAAGQTLSLQPLLGVLLAVLLLGEQLHAHHFAGMVLILLGIAVPIAFNPLRTRLPPR